MGPSWEICDTDGAIKDDSIKNSMGLKMMAAHSKKTEMFSPESCRAAADFIYGYINAPTFSLKKKSSQFNQ